MVKLSYQHPEQEFDVIETDTYYRSLDEQRTQNWHSLRYGRITGTMVGKLMSGTNRQQCLDEIMGISRPVYDEYILQCMEYGNTYEPIARKFLSELLEVEIEEWGIIISKQNPRFGASLDGYIQKLHCSVEIKCPQYIKSNYDTIIRLLNNGDDIDKVLQKYMPYNYYDQVQWGLFISGLKMCIFFVFCPNDSRYIKIDIPACESYQEKMKEIADSFISMLG